MTAQLYTVNAAATLLEKDRRLIQRVLREVPPDSKAGGKTMWRLPTIVNALIADAESHGVDAEPGLTSARTRVAVARAETAERQNALDAGEWIKIEDAISYHAAELLRIREHFLSMPGKLCGPLAGVDSIDAYRIVHDEVWESLDAYAGGEGSVAFIIESIERCGGKVSDPEAKALLKIIPILYDDLDEARELIRKNKAKGA